MLQWRLQTFSPGSYFQISSDSQMNSKENSMTLKAYRHQLRANNCFTSDFMGICQEQENGETWESQGPLQDPEESILPPFTKPDGSFFLVVVSGSNLDFCTVLSLPSCSPRRTWPSLASLPDSISHLSLCLPSLSPPSYLSISLLP